MSYETVILGAPTPFFAKLRLKLFPLYFDGFYFTFKSTEALTGLFRLKEGDESVYSLPPKSVFLIVSDFSCFAYYED